MGFFVVGGVFLTFCLPPCKTKPTSPLWSRGSGTTIRDLTHSPMLVPSGSFPDCELNSPQAAHQERDPTGNNMDLGNWETSNNRYPPCNTHYTSSHAA